MSMYLLQLSVVFILSIPFHQIVEIWSPLLSSSGNFGTLSPESNLTDFSEAFLTPRMAVEAPLCSGSKAPLCSGSQSCLGTSVSAEMDMFSFGLPSCQFPSEPSLLSPQSLYSRIFPAAVTASFWETEEFGSFIGFLGPQAPRYRAPGTFGPRA